ncbi:MAG: DNA recombination protein RmuC [Candidatus Omnitrophica bacterium]|nr:DNA recombination protein RmuC [Candidatus Omnitrophota bacterium]
MALYIVVFFLGLVIGFVGAYFFKKTHTQQAKDIAGEILKETEEKMRSAFGNLSLEALAKFHDLAKERLDSQVDRGAKQLDSKKELIDQQLHKMSEELKLVSTLVKDFEKDRENKFGKLTQHLEEASKQTESLRNTTNSLKEALASSKTRGQWGERMAEDVLRLAGFVEKINYLKQATIDGAGSRPDYTFLLPNDMKLNMDVKFPLDNYIKFLNADMDSEKEEYKKTFFKDIKLKLNEVTTRDYINTKQNTLDYVLLFIPNEQIYTFIQQQDTSIIDESLKKKVLLCSPITIFAILAVIRQAIDNFALEKTSSKIMALLGTFKKKWEMFVQKMSDVERSLDKAKNDFDQLKGVRTRELDRPLQKLDDMRQQQGIELEADEEGEQEIR